MKKEFIFEKDIQSINETNVHPTGWYPVVIEHGITSYGESSALQMCWRVKGTEHVFKIPLITFYEDAQEDYGKHFEKVLEIFRKDYISWYKQGFTEEWMQKYRRQFKEYIYTFN